MQFKVERFERHRDGYLHARVIVGEKVAYFHRMYGSWLAPGHVGGHAVLKEPEALLGSDIGRELKFKLSELSRPYDQHARREREEQEERERRANNKPAKSSEDSGGIGETAGADRVSDGGDRSGDQDDSQPDGA